MVVHAFKEWAVICRALAEGHQALILRKGGISERGGVFFPEHARFWLYPTYVHQQADGIKQEALPLLHEALRAKTADGMLSLSHFVEVSGVFFVQRLDEAHALAPLHIWSPETVGKRFHYREPGLYVLAVRVFRLPEACLLPLRPEYEGCKTWVELPESPSTTGAEPVIASRQYADFLEQLDARFHPRHFA